MVKLVNQKTVNEGSSSKEKFQLEVEFQKKHDEVDQTGQAGTSTEVDQKEGETQTEQGQEDSSTEEDD